MENFMSKYPTSKTEQERQLETQEEKACFNREVQDIIVSAIKRTNERRKKENTGFILSDDLMQRILKMIKESDIHGKIDEMLQVPYVQPQRIHLTQNDIAMMLIEQSKDSELQSRYEAEKETAEKEAEVILLEDPDILIREPIKIATIFRRAREIIDSQDLEVEITAKNRRPYIQTSERQGER